MDNSDLSGIAVWALMAGVCSFVALDHNLKQPYRANVTHWCIAAGACSILYLASFFLFNSRPIATQGAMLSFVGSPALICGLLLTASDRLRKYKSKNKGEV